MSPLLILSHEKGTFKTKLIFLTTFVSVSCNEDVCRSVRSLIEVVLLFLTRWRSRPGIQVGSSWYTLMLVFALHQGAYTY